ncbi:MAG: bifunctional methylenetetrahydrofolate dehydrogenase/methenyltetrahydrofolate cyclohydrolase FolD [Candidatus Thermofonsia Clade 1 bacterium]|uniref:Bifunctional protein FolD n=1 Tax=Candidatus Thermofonsia Clade 1 bacterium TaxID=2364210 RepID=A0A2M8PFA9_9CHLR|nr:MAG: bifunctional methylenetetrahydrofolate dehydrogenase/methenyltetrahydrofolate cyclohydrolase FolD [Candidatus Thermofonsia Clade 1 bacterium]
MSLEHIATLIDGRAVAAQIRAEVAVRAAALAERGVRPGLAAVLVGDNPASQAYVRMKRKACAEVGIESFYHELPAQTTQAELEGLVEALNARSDVHGILVQLPLPAHLDEQRVLSLISTAKDVDGFHPLNIGRLAMKGREPDFIPATPAGIMRLLEAYQAPFAGANAVVLGRSNIVGMPCALLLTKRDCTVTLCHSRTRDLPEVVRHADILVAAVGRPHMVKGDWIKPGAFVIDVGTNRVADPSAKDGSRLVGDVDFEAARRVAGAITPVPGGVGPMTIAMLLENTVKAAERSLR